MSGAKSRAITVETRALVQSAKLAVRDVFDAIVELVTNADDRYQRLRRPGVMEIEVERRRGAGRSVLRVRDHADGMDAETMERKLSTIGGRESGLAEGEAVRGTHSRGAKDVAALGRVIFESIAGDGRYHRCEISEFFEFTLHESEDVTPEIRERLGLRAGTGTVVTIELDKTQSVPQHDNLKLDIARLVSLRGILADPERKVLLKDGTHGRATEVKAPVIQGTERVKETFEVPGHPGVSAKLVIGRAKKPFEKDRQRFRAGGIQIRSKRAIHEATLFDSALESDPHALWFYGRLTCDHIDVLCNAFDDRFAQKLPPHPDNPTYPLDPSRRSGLNREHPFVKALFRAALIRLRPLVEEERTREENERSRIESDKTRKRLLALEKAALDFMRDFGEEDEPSRDPDGGHAESNFQERGFGIWPPFARLVVGKSQNFTLTVLQKAFPEIQLGDTVQIECHTEDIAVSRKYCGMDSHPTREAMLRAVWTVKGVAVTPASGIRVRVGPIVAESVVEVLPDEAARYADVKAFQFGHDRYRMRTDQKRKRVTLLAPLALVATPAPFTITCDSPHFDVKGQRMMLPRPDLGIAQGELTLRCDGTEARAMLTATLGETNAKAQVTSFVPLGADLSIRIEDIDLGNQRYRWRQNVLEIAARHPSLTRYLGDKSAGFPGQESKHFRVLIAEIVTDAVSAVLVRRSVQANPEEYEDADWDAYYAQYSRLMTLFLPIAHKLQCPEG